VISELRILELGRVAKIEKFWTDLTLWHDLASWQNFAMTTLKTPNTEIIIN
jgi:hypothetical protein